MYIVVTGAAGFIWSNIVKALNARGERKIIAVDNLKRGDKFVNLADCDIADYLDKDTFLRELSNGTLNHAVATISHHGACSDTTEADGRYMMQNNYQYSRELLTYSIKKNIRLIYASSAAVYGDSLEFRENRVCEAPINVYGYSKFLFDQYVRRSSFPAVGLRYFNVYGEREQHKGRMASVVLHFFNQYRKYGKVKVFKGTGSYDHGEQRRDFVSVEDVVNVNLFFLDHPEKSGIFNVGTGVAQTYNEVAVATVNACRKHQGEVRLSLAMMLTAGIIEYIPLPIELEGKYQSYTQADISALRASSYYTSFLTVEQGVTRYVEKLFS